MTIDSTSEKRTESRKGATDWQPLCQAGSQVPCAPGGHDDARIGATGRRGGGRAQAPGPDLLADVRRLDAEIKATKIRVAVAVEASKTSLADIYGVGPIVAPSSSATPPMFGASPAATSSPPTTARLPSRRRRGRRGATGSTPRGNRQLNHACTSPPSARSDFRHPGARLLPSQGRGGQDQEGSHPGPQAPALRRRLPPAPRRRRSRRRLSGPGRTTRERLFSSVTGLHPDHRSPFAGRMVRNPPSPSTGEIPGLCLQAQRESWLGGTAAHAPSPGGEADRAVRRGRQKGA